MWLAHSFVSNSRARGLPLLARRILSVGGWAEPAGAPPESLATRAPPASGGSGSSSSTRIPSIELSDASAAGAAETRSSLGRAVRISITRVPTSLRATRCRMAAVALSAE